MRNEMFFLNCRVHRTALYYRLTDTLRLTAWTHWSATRECHSASLSFTPCSSEGLVVAIHHSSSPALKYRWSHSRLILPSLYLWSFFDFSISRLCRCTGFFNYIMRFVLGDSRLLVRDILPGHILDSSSHGISGIIPRATSLKYFAESTVHLLTVLFILFPFRPQILEIGQGRWTGYYTCLTSTFTLAPTCISSILVAELAYVQYIINH